jgi:hypothetical protein
MPKLASDDCLWRLHWLQLGLDNCNLANLATDDVEKRCRNTTSISDPLSWKLAASILFDIYGPSRVPIKSNFTRATLKTQTVNYFLFAVTIFQNGCWPLRWLWVGPKNLVLLKNHSADVKDAVGILLPAWYSPSWKMATSCFGNLQQAHRKSVPPSALRCNQAIHFITHDTAHERYI